MKSSLPARLVVLFEGMTVPPRQGATIHLLSLAEAAARHMPTTVLHWEPRESVRATVAEPNPVTLLQPLRRRGVSANPLVQKLLYTGAAFAWLRANAGKGSVVWIRGYATALAALPWIRACRLRGDGYRFVYDCSSFLRLEHAIPPPVRFGPAKALIEQWTRGRFDTIRTLSPAMRDYLVESGVAEAKVLVLPVGAKRQDLRWSPSLRPSRLLYSGSAREWQGLDVLLAAMKLLQHTNPEIRLTILGARESDVPAGHLVGTNVTFAGAVSHEQTGSYYLSHDLLVIPRRRMPLTEVVVPMKVAEAMAYGIPILTTDLSPIRWATGDDGAFFVAEPSPKLIASAIVRAMSDPGGLQTVSRAATQQFERFAWDNLGAQLCDALFPALTRPE